MKLVHISDLHIDAVNKKENLFRTRKILEYIHESGYDHLVITGDITENGDKDSFELTRKLLKQFGMLDESKTSLVIGNHDIYGGVHLAEEIVNFPRKCKYTDYDIKINEFEQYFPETFKNTYRPLRNNPFPYVKEFDDFIIIGLNSIARYSFIKNPFASNGTITKKQFSALSSILSSPAYSKKRIIVLIHHHFTKDLFERESSVNYLWNKIERRTMKLYGKKSLMKLFRKYGVDIILHGHLHETRRYYRKGLLFVNGGGSVLNSERDSMKINIINIERSGIRTEILSHSCSERYFYPEHKNKSIFKIPAYPAAGALPADILLSNEIYIN